MNRIKKAKAVENDKQFPLQAAFSAIYKLNEREITAGRIREAILKAAKRGNPEFIVEAIRIHYPFLWNTNDENGRNIFFLAVEFRQAAVLNLIHGLAMKHVFANMRDKGANCLLHMAGLPPPSSHLNRISGALLQMQREMQWFKEVESIIPHMKKEYLNRENKTPRDLFTENHRELLKQGEKWTKANAGSCSVVAALVATITFAAAFTVPGGNDQIKGYPIFLHKSLFVLFMISNATSLFSSTTSLLIFLALLNSRYAEDDFLKSLPSKMIIGLSTMLFSLANMMLAFCAALFLTLKSQAWIVIPVTFLGCVPVIFYIWLQFPLLIEIIMSTYGPGIFNRNVKRWP
nr:ankyrin repeat-containing protein NPR4-like [Arachis hypogaea]